jgi:hypothetical protein
MITISDTAQLQSGTDLASKVSYSASPSASNSSDRNPLPGYTRAGSYPDDDDDDSDDTSGGDPVESLAEWIEKLQVNPLHPRQVIGPWSGQRLVQSAHGLKQQVNGASSILRRPDVWSIPPVRFLLILSVHT